MTELHTMGIVVMGDENVKVADVGIAIDDVWHKATGTSRRDPSDSPSDDIGERLALGRAIRQLGRNILRDVQDEIREKAKQDEIAKAAQHRALRERKARLSSPRDVYPYPLVQEADPEIEQLLAEEETILQEARDATARQTAGFVAGIGG